MGCYVNPSDMSKEEFLRKYGVPINGSEAVITEDNKPVCLVDNGPFTAAAVAFDAQELKTFQREDDVRPKRWFQVPRDKLLEVSDLAKWE